MKTLKQFATASLVLSAIILSGCATPERPAHRAKGKLLQDAESYVSELRLQNHLPGFTKEDHGRLIATAPWGDGSVSYPASVIVQAWKNGETSVYHFDLAKADSQASWHLVGATRTDKNGQSPDDLLRNQ